MRTKKDEKFKLESVEELLGVVNEESAMDIEISKIQPFRAHPFKVLDDDKMQELIDSISVNGILTPVLVRPLGMDTYEMISGHRRMHAAKIVGLIFNSEYIFSALRIFSKITKNVSDLFGRHLLWLCISGGPSIVICIWSIDNSFICFWKKFYLEKVRKQKMKLI